MSEWPGRRIDEEIIEVALYTHPVEPTITPHSGYGSADFPTPAGPVEWEAVVVENAGPLTLDEAKVESVGRQIVDILHETYGRKP